MVIDRSRRRRWKNRYADAAAQRALNRKLLLHRFRWISLGSYGDHDDIRCWRRYGRRITPRRSSSISPGGLLSYYDQRSAQSSIASTAG